MDAHKRKMTNSKAYPEKKIGGAAQTTSGKESDTHATLQKRFSTIQECLDRCKDRTLNEQLRLFSHVAKGLKASTRAVEASFNMQGKHRTTDLAEGYQLLDRAEDLLGKASMQEWASRSSISQRQ
uniref:HPt domain-containing protein n=1 Tax=Trichuris muris TaxID=70415 RepID=A0A5S6Q7H0_TRIMR